MKRTALAISQLLLVSFLFASAGRAGTLQTLWTGEANAIDGQNIVGETTTGFATRYDGTTSTAFRPPGAAFSAAFGISSGVIVGDDYSSTNGYQNFVLNGSTYSGLSDPSGTAGTTLIYGIDGSQIIGTYVDALNQTHGFIYDAGTWKTLDDPLAAKGTFPLGVSGGQIVGAYLDSSGVPHGFLYDGSSWSTIDDPSSPSGSYATGISAGTIVGVDTPFSPATNLLQIMITQRGGANNAYIYNQATYDHPLSLTGIYFSGISGDRIVGYYRDSSGGTAVERAFAYSVPEPSSASLGVIAAMCAVHWTTSLLMRSAANA